MSSSSAEDRRRSERTPIRLDVLWSTDALATDDEPSEAVVTDLSHGGARLLCSRYLPEFTRVSLTFQTGDRTFTCQGLVVWCARTPQDKPPSFVAGINFQSVDNALRDRLTRLIEQYRIPI